MTRNFTEHDFLRAIFSDETERFRSPAEPDAGQTVSVRLRVPKTEDAISVKLILAAITEISEQEITGQEISGQGISRQEAAAQQTTAHEIDRQQTIAQETAVQMIPMRGILMHEISPADGQQFAMFEASFTCPEEPVSYYFSLEYQGRTYICQKNGAKESSASTNVDHNVDPNIDPNADPNADPDPIIDPHYAFRFTPGFHTPDWAKGAVQYQIFPDRFCNGDPSNDVKDGEYSYHHRHVRRIADWNALPEEDDYRCFYGGDIKGIIDKLDYLEGLGIEVIYLNPIFLSPSSHKYDTQDYEHIDPHFGVIEDDIDLPLEDWEFHNGYARQYITRVLSKKNLELSDGLFAQLCDELHKRSMKIILDGVFNHCGSFHQWMDHEGIYLEKEGFAPGAYQDVSSPYREFFRFTDEKPGYEAWWDVETLPKLNYENSRKLWDTIFSAVQKWLAPPYCIDGWRLDVAADLGHSLDLNHAFWREFREKVKSVNPQAIIIAEHYGDPGDWLKGDQWDSIMNYCAFMEPLTFFLTGMEKHSDGIHDDLYQDGGSFFETMQKYMACFQEPSLQCAMNELSNHDHSRFLTRTNRTVGRMNSLGAEAADKDTDKAVLRLAATVQMTWPGAPTIYYGDEAGLAGWTDPDNRRCYPWGSEDMDLIEFHRRLISLRRSCPVLKTGSILPLGAGRGWIAYARFDAKDLAIIACNNTGDTIDVTLDAFAAEAREGERFSQIFACGRDESQSGFSGGSSDETKETASVSDGRLQLTLSPQSAVILVR